MACKFIPRITRTLVVPTLSNEDFVRFLLEDHRSRRSCIEDNLGELGMKGVVGDDITLLREEKIPTEIFDFFYDPNQVAAKLDVLADLELSKISKSTSAVSQNVTDRRSKVKRK